MVQKTLTGCLTLAPLPSRYFERVLALTDRASQLATIVAQATVSINALPPLVPANQPASRPAVQPANPDPNQPANANPNQHVAVPQPAGVTKAKAKKKKTKRTQEKLQFARKKPKTSGAGKKSRPKAPPQSALREVTNLFSTRFHGAQSLHNNHGANERASTCSMSLSPQARLLLDERVGELEDEENLVPADAAPAMRAPARRALMPAMRHHALPAASATAASSSSSSRRPIGDSVFVPRHRASTPTSAQASTDSPLPRVAPAQSQAIGPSTCIGRNHRGCCRCVRPWVTPVPRLP